MSVFEWQEGNSPHVSYSADEWPSYQTIFRCLFLRCAFQHKLWKRSSTISIRKQIAKVWNFPSDKVSSQSELLDTVLECYTGVTTFQRRGKFWLKNPDTKALEEGFEEQERVLVAVRWQVLFCSTHRNLPFACKQPRATWWSQTSQRLQVKDLHIWSVRCLYSSSKTMHMKTTHGHRFEAIGRHFCLAPH